MFGNMCSAYRDVMFQVVQTLLLLRNAVGVRQQDVVIGAVFVHYVSDGE